MQVSCLCYAGVWGGERKQGENAVYVHGKGVDPMLEDGSQKSIPTDNDAESAGEGPANAHGGTSEVARLRQLITAEYEAAARGLTGLAQGTARHAFIDARMNRVWHYSEQL